MLKQFKPFTNIKKGETMKNLLEMHTAFNEKMEVFNKKLKKNKEKIIVGFADMQVQERLESHKTMRKKQTMEDAENLLEGDDELEEMIITE